MGMALDRQEFWQVATASRMNVIIDAEDYFANVRLAMLKAQRRIMLIGWDFDARIALVSGARLDDEPAAVGDFISWLVARRPALEVFVLRWDLGALKTLARSANLVTVGEWMLNARIHTKLDSFHPSGSSHHQKIVVIDDCVAFCGGIDMTIDRWDTREHRDDDPRRVRPNGELYPPWHDATTALEGPAAAALGELARLRWHRAGGETIAAHEGLASCWPDTLDPQFEAIDVGIARTEPAMPDSDEVREIEALFVRQIEDAKHNIYAESQYFTSRRIAAAIGKRLQAPDCPEIILVTPVSADGWLETQVMDTARARVVAGLQRLDPGGRLRIYHPYTAQGTPIYAHAKVMIVDGASLRIGSANMNNRSMGFDTECDILIAPGDNGAASIVSIRDGLIAEHLGVEVGRLQSEIRSCGSIIDAIEALRGSGRSLRPYVVPEMDTLDEWLAENSVLDPDGHTDDVEPSTITGKF
jgi:phosphatidylserine/phosphatidylglycerophosphate/cardiolipin synthase-like enzyme